MLSKSQARLFFWAGTLLFSCLFLFLTVDTIRKGPEQTNSKNITEAVKAGKLIFDKNNCMGCHTILGEGAYYAPELTKVYDRRGAAWMRVFLKDPQAMFPGERKMVQYDFSEEDITNLIAFFKWIGEMDLNGFPPKPNIKANTAATADSPKIAAPQKFTQLCTACHAVAGQGGTVGPDLLGVGKKYNKDYLTKWVANPSSVKPGTNMPKLPLDKPELDEIVDYLSKL